MAGMHRLHLVLFVLIQVFAMMVTSQLEANTTSTSEEIKQTLAGWREVIVTKISSKIDALSQLPGKITDFEMVGRVIDATIEEDCELDPCPNNFVKEPNPNSFPRSNGCGSFGLHWRRGFLPDESQEDCCNEHDFCYDKCDADKDLCDLHFKRCLYKPCRGHQKDWTPNQLKVCKAAAKLMYIATQALGCQAYHNAQQNACRCVSLDRKEILNPWTNETLPNNAPPSSHQRPMLLGLVLYYITRLYTNEW